MLTRVTLGTSYESQLHGYAGARIQHLSFALGASSLSFPSSSRRAQPFWLSLLCTESPARIPPGAHAQVPATLLAASCLGGSPGTILSPGDEDSCLAFCSLPIRRMTKMGDMNGVQLVRRWREGTEGRGVIPPLGASTRHLILQKAQCVHVLLNSPGFGGARSRIACFHLCGGSLRPA